MTVATDIFTPGFNATSAATAIFWSVRVTLGATLPLA
jgi:hypothetical protein